MSEGAEAKFDKKKPRANTIFWIVSSVTLILYVLAFPTWLYSVCSTSENLGQTIPGQITITGQQSENDAGTNQQKAVSTPASVKRAPSQQTIEQTAKATYYPPKEPIRIWWRGSVCEINSSDFLIGFFTLILAISTIGLWVQTQRLAEGAEGQSEDTRKSLEIASRAADAAQKSAEAADLSAKAGHGVELPYLRAMEFTTAPYIEDKREWLKNFTPVITIKNFGRTPAFVSEVIFNVHIGAILPPEREIKRMDKYPKPLVIEARESIDVTGYSFARENNLTAENIDDFVADEGDWIFVYGVVYFVDFLGNSHEQGFVFMWVPASKAWVNPTSARAKPYQIQK
jgi:hypothetical protein